MNRGKHRLGLENTANGCKTNEIGRVSKIGAVLGLPTWGHYTQHNDTCCLVRMLIIRDDIL
jgi:hypothetical protein